MKIQSRFKDYYDYVAHLYGGGDPKIVYVREPLTAFSESGYRPSVSIDYQVEYYIPESLKNGTRFQYYNFQVLVVMDRPYLMYQLGMMHSQYNNMSELHNWRLYDFITNPLELKDKRFTWSDNTLEYPKGEPSANILALTKLVGAPVYTIQCGDRSKKYVTVQSEIPNLGNLGLASIYPPFQLYQDLAYFIGNTMKDSPDTAPPVEVSDLDRLQQYGFDRKVSFRHRK